MQKEKRHLTLDADVLEGLKPHLKKIGLSLSAYVRFILAQTYVQLSAIGTAVDVDKPVTDISIGDIIKVAKAMEAARQIELKDDVTDQKGKARKVQE